ncbi:hypothetical protein GCM10009737_12300 [Nocardioides lentus]|uniref:Flp pilus assembly protein RcpC/CpaB domain-containing protein n=1 Tax=Nocardioides lentus TaxID=338077 RepID=A0ABP5AIC3_9ACTN
MLVAAVVVAVIGAALVLVYARGADSRAAEGLESVDVLTVTQTVEVGESVADARSAGKFATTTVPLDAMLPGAQTDLAALEGLFATTRLLPGEQVVVEKFGGESEQTTSLAIPRDKMAASVELTDPQRVAGFISPGSYVSVVYTGPGAGTESGTISRVLLRRVQVLGVGSTTPTTTTTTTEEGAQTTEQLPTTILTLALDEDEVTKVNYGVVTATQLSVALLTDDSTVDGLEATTADNLFED